ncbi:TPA: hypothetical protein ACK3Q6_004430 [Burkholderia cepacia]
MIERREGAAGWRADAGGYGWTHYDAEGMPSGWLVGLCRIDGVPTYMLWNGNETQGRFGSLELAQDRHAELTGFGRDAGAKHG